MAEEIVESTVETAAQEVAEELAVNRSMAVWHLKQIAKVKRLDKWVAYELTANQKLSSF